MTMIIMEMKVKEIKTKEVKKRKEKRDKKTLIVILVLTMKIMIRIVWIVRV